MLSNGRFSEVALQHPDTSRMSAVGREFQLLKCQINNLIPDNFRHTVPCLIGTRALVFQPHFTKPLIQIIPTVKGRAGDPLPIQRVLDRQVISLNNTDNLKLLGCWISYPTSSPSNKPLLMGPV